MSEDKELAAALGAQAQPEPKPIVEPQPEPQVSNKPIIDNSVIQTKDNTTNHVTLPARTQSLGEFPENTRGSFVGFIGLTKNSMDTINERLSIWQEYISANAWMGASEKERNKEKVSLSQLQAAITTWKEYCAENFPDQSLEDVNARQMHIYQFLQNVADPLLSQYSVVREPGLTNVSQRLSNLQGSDIYALVPQNNDAKKFGLAELMRRTSMTATKTPYNYDLLMRNSYVGIRYVKPTRMEVGDLINNIAKSTVGHVRTLSQNLPALGNIAAIRVIWNFIKDRIINCTVKDTSDYGELADIIRITDINVIAGGLLAQAYPHGVNFHLSCLAKETCSWNKRDMIDPTSLIIDRKWLDTKEESAVYANLMNYSRRYSREESLELIDNTDFQHEIEPVYNENSTACFILGVPSLTESFEAEEFFSDLVKERLDRIREQSMTEKQYFADRDEFLNGLVGTDYLHYISEYHILPEPGTDGTVIKMKRRECDPVEFNQGIVNIIQDNMHMATGLVTAIIKHYPFMSKTFVGMANYACENCKGESEAYEDLGYTPINIIQTFFTLVNLTFTGQSRVGENAKAEALLDITR